MLLSLLALLATQSAAAADNVVAVPALGEGRYRRVMISTESADAAARKMLAAMEDACRETGIANQSHVRVKIVKRQKPLRLRLLQAFTCNAAVGRL